MLPSLVLKISRQGTYLLDLKPRERRNSNKSSHQYLPLNVMPHMDLASLTGFPQYGLNSGNKLPITAGIITKILERVLACKKAPMKSSCFTLAFKREACARNIFNERNEAVGDHLSLVAPFWGSPHTTIRVFNLSRDPSLLILTLNISMTGVLDSPSRISSNTKIHCRPVSPFPF
jgi:hypothetical protein